LFRSCARQAPQSPIINRHLLQLRDDKQPRQPPDLRGFFSNDECAKAANPRTIEAIDLLQCEGGLDSAQEFLSRLEKGPAFLFLGQNYLCQETGVDPFLTEILRKYSEEAAGKATYFRVFESSATATLPSTGWKRGVDESIRLPNGERGLAIG
jgi:hypothetical protein